MRIIRRNRIPNYTRTVYILRTHKLVIKMKLTFIHCLVKKIKAY